MSYQMYTSLNKNNKLVFFDSFHFLNASSSSFRVGAIFECIVFVLLSYIFPSAINIQVLKRNMFIRTSYFVASTNLWSSLVLLFQSLRM